MVRVVREKVLWGGDNGIRGGDGKAGGVQLEKQVEHAGPECRIPQSITCGQKKGQGGACSHVVPLHSLPPLCCCPCVSEEIPWAFWAQKFWNSPGPPRGGPGAFI